MEQTIKMLNEGFLRKYLKESEDIEEEKDEIEVGDLFTNGDETYELLDVKIDEDGEVVVEAENQETGEPEEIEYLSKEEAEEKYGEYDPSDDEEEEELTDLTVECINKRKFMEKFSSLRNLNEAEMSPEDKKDSEILRNIYNKSLKRKNAKLTPEEKAVMDKFGLKRNGWDGTPVKPSDPKKPYSPTTPIVKDKERQRRSRWDSTRGDITNDKINLADRARKIDTRGGGYEANNVWADYDPSREYKKTGEDRYTRLKDKGLLDKERALQNARMQDTYNSMKSALQDRKYHQQNLDDIDAKYDKKWARLQAEMDRLSKDQEWEKQYHSQHRADSQDRIDRMLRRNESLKEELLDRYVSDFKSDVYNALAKVMYKWDRKDIQPSEKDMDLAYDWFSTHFWNSDDWY